ncbi:hypothetical protein HMN09_00460800 [Mycena chlorophos]|uniref:Uncharacterized protein n=1 Tax=Mycena chlorophos TaxID=658473 RepID=A0A8H6TID9_MYCCL|nr:hypothetical protein HMN09_00460800 [Mycena chlorophos]
MSTFSSTTNQRTRRGFIPGGIFDLDSDFDDDTEHEAEVQPGRGRASTINVNASTSASRIASPTSPRTPRPFTPALEVQDISHLDSPTLAQYISWIAHPLAPQAAEFASALRISGSALRVFDRRMLAALANHDDAMEDQLFRVQLGLLPPEPVSEVADPEADAEELEPERGRTGYPGPQSVEAATEPTMAETADDPPPSSPDASAAVAVDELVIAVPPNAYDASSTTEPVVDDATVPVVIVPSSPEKSTTALEEPSATRAELTSDAAHDEGGGDEAALDPVETVTTPNDAAAKEDEASLPLPEPQPSAAEPLPDGDNNPAGAGANEKTSVDADPAPRQTLAPQSSDADGPLPNEPIVPETPLISAALVPLPESPFPECEYALPPSPLPEPEATLLEPGSLSALLDEPVASSDLPEEAPVPPPSSAPAELSPNTAALLSLMGLDLQIGASASGEDGSQDAYAHSDSAPDAPDLVSEALADGVGAGDGRDEASVPSEQSEEPVQVPEPALIGPGSEGSDAPTVGHATEPIAPVLLGSIDDHAAGEAEAPAASPKDVDVERVGGNEITEPMAALEPQEHDQIPSTATELEVVPASDHLLDTDVTHGNASLSSDPSGSQAPGSADTTHSSLPDTILETPGNSPAASRPGVDVPGRKLHPPLLDFDLMRLPAFSFGHEFAEEETDAGTMMIGESATGSTMLFREFAGKDDDDAELLSAIQPEGDGSSAETLPPAPQIEIDGAASRNTFVAQNTSPPARLERESSVPVGTQKGASSLSGLPTIAEDHPFRQYHHARPPHRLEIVIPVSPTSLHEELFQQSPQLFSPISSSTIGSTLSPMTPLPPADRVGGERLAMHRRAWSATEDERGGIFSPLSFPRNGGYLFSEMSSPVVKLKKRHAGRPKAQSQPQTAVEYRSQGISTEPEPEAKHPQCPPEVIRTYSDSGVQADVVVLQKPTPNPPRRLEDAEVEIGQLRRRVEKLERDLRRERALASAAASPRSPQPHSPSFNHHSSHSDASRYRHADRHAPASASAAGRDRDRDRHYSDHQGHRRRESDRVRSPPAYTNSRSSPPPTTMTRSFLVKAASTDRRVPESIPFNFNFRNWSETILGGGGSVQQPPAPVQMQSYGRSSSSQ